MTDIKEILEDACSDIRNATMLEEIQRIARSTARTLVQAQGATFVLLDGLQCFYADEDAISPLWKGERFPVTECISGWAMLHRTATIVPDIRIDERIPQAAYRPTFVRSLAMVPIRIANPVGAIGTYWSRLHHATDEEMANLTHLAEVTGEVLPAFLTDYPTSPTLGTPE